jgi:hypothetical protein
VSATAWPKSVREVSLRARDQPDAFDFAHREFLDFFYANPARRDSALRGAPVTLNDLQDAYLAATAEHLARVFKLSVPEWTETYGLALTRPFFAGGLESLKATLTVESPLAFRCRLLFISKDALSRPRLEGG